MKTCIKCGFVGDDELFKPKTNRCKNCIYLEGKLYRERNAEKIKQKKREYELNNREIIKEKHHQYYLNNKEHLYKQTTEWVKANREKRKEICKRYDEKNKEVKKEKSAIYRMNNKEKLKLIHAKYRKEKLDIIKLNKRKYRDSEKGKNQTLKERDYRKGLGHNPLNTRFDGCEEHHLRYSNSQEDKDNDMTIYVPRYLHQSIKHNGNTGKNMREINIVCLEWYFANTPEESRNKKAIDLYLKYCMLPEPVWESEQITA